MDVSTRNQENDGRLTETPAFERSECTLKFYMLSDSPARCERLGFVAVDRAVAIAKARVQGSSRFARCRLYCDGVAVIEFKRGAMRWAHAT